jgi:hypothetical protein
MTIEEVIYQRVTTGLASLIGTRCYPLNVPQDVALPAVTYQTSSVPQFSHSGYTNLTETRVQFTVLAEDYATLKELYATLLALFNAVRFATTGGPTVQLARIDNGLDDFDTTDFEPLNRLDVLLIHTTL